MGRIRTKKTKRIAEDLIKRNKGYFSKDFSENKTKLTDVAKVPTKKFRNVIAGYISKRVKKTQN